MLSYTNEELAERVTEEQYRLVSAAQSLDHGLRNEDGPLLDDDVEELGEALDSLEELAFAIVQRTDDAERIEEIVEPTERHFRLSRR